MENDEPALGPNSYPLVDLPTVRNDSVEPRFPTSICNVIEGL